MIRYYLNLFFKKITSDLTLSYILRIVVLLFITSLYAIFDVFNKRNVPDFFVYAGLIVAFLITLTYNTATILSSLFFAVVILAIGYSLYRKGVLGAGDFLEFVTIGLILPTQPIPIHSNIFQFGMPFIFSVFIATGYTAIIGMAVYYLLLARINSTMKTLKPTTKNIISGIVILVAYVFFLLFVEHFVGVSFAADLLVMAIAIASFLIIVFEKAINQQMISFIYPKQLVDGDMIAMNFMHIKDIKYFKSKSKLFDRLATKKLISEIKGVKKKIPIYTNGVPLALFALIGVILSLIFGNLLLYVIF